MAPPANASRMPEGSAPGVTRARSCICLPGSWLAGREAAAASRAIASRFRSQAWRLQVGTGGSPGLFGGRGQGDGEEAPTGLTVRLGDLSGAGEPRRRLSPPPGFVVSSGARSARVRGSPSGGRSGLLHSGGSCVGRRFPIYDTLYRTEQDYIPSTGHHSQRGTCGQTGKHCITLRTEQNRITSPAPAIAASVAHGQTGKHTL